MAANLSDRDSLSESVGEIAIDLYGWPSVAPLKNLILLVSKKPTEDAPTYQAREKQQ